MEQLRTRAATIVSSAPRFTGYELELELVVRRTTGPPRVSAAG